MPWSWKAAVRPAPPSWSHLVGERVEVARLMSWGGVSSVLWMVLSLVVSSRAAAIALTVGWVVAGGQDVLGTGNVWSVIPACGALALVLALGEAANTWRGAIAKDVQQRIDGRVRKRVRELAAAQPSLLELADPAFQDDVNRAADLGRKAGRLRSVGGAVLGQWTLMWRLVDGVLVAVVLARYSIWAAVAVPLLCLAARAVLRRQFMYLAQDEDSRARLKRRTEFWSGLVEDGRIAGEIRLFGLGPWLRLRHRRSWAGERGGIMRDKVLIAKQQVVVVGLILLAAIAGVVPVTLIAFGGELDAAGYMTALTAVWGAMSLAGMGHEAFDIEYGKTAVAALRRLRPPVGGPCEDHPVADASNLLELEDVSFGYPGRDQPVLSGLDLAIRRGEVLGMVGVNGAGKTTAMKLLAGLFRPTRGDIRGVDPAGVAVVFQDLVHYPLSLRDNIVAAAPNGSPDDSEVLAALEQAGAAELVTRLADGLDTVLQRDVRSGTDLSGGQWQRIAIARVIYAVRKGRRLVILDEPTANLDVRAETQFYSRVVDLLPEATVVLVSHRMSTVRRADRIVMLDGGQITETGTHAELVAAEGEYARLFTLQSARFAESEQR